MLNSHPKHTVKHFYKPHYGASKMKWQYNLPYKRYFDSLFHYPAVSDVTGKPIDWCYGEPDDGYSASRIFGEHTLELKGMPMGHTPEYIQERLRRFFSKLGPVAQCRAEPHSHDPYQCEGTAYVTFRDRDTALKALKAPLKFPASLHDKTIHMRHLDSDKRNDPNYRDKAKFWNGELLALAKKMHIQLSTEMEATTVGKPLARLGREFMERELVGADARKPEPGWERAGIPVKQGLHNVATRFVPAGTAVTQRFGSWESFLATAPIDELFKLERRPDAKQPSKQVAVVIPRLVSTVQRARILARGRMTLDKLLHEEFSIWWREGKVQLPKYTEDRIKWWDHKPRLPFELQTLSRPKDRVRIHDERWLYKMQLNRVRNDKRKEVRSEYQDNRRKMIEAKRQDKQERRQKALEEIKELPRRSGGLRGAVLSRGLVTPGYEQEQRAREMSR